MSVPALGSEAEVRLSVKNGEKLDMLLIVTQLTDAKEVENISAKFASHGQFRVTQQVTDLSKGISKLYIAAESSIDEAEKLLVALGFSSIRFNGTMIQTESLSEIYVPIEPEEVRTINRGKQ